MLRRFFIVFFILVLLIAAAGAGAYWYVSPSQSLNLNYEEVPLQDRALNMAKRLSTELILSEEDVNNLGKKQAAQNPRYQPDAVITGASFRIEGELLVADVNAKWRDRVPVGLTIKYRLKWASPNLVAEVAEAKLKDIKLSADSSKTSLFRSATNFRNCSR